MDQINEVLERSFDLLELLSEATDSNKRLTVLKKFVEGFEKAPRLPDFEKGLKWFNVRKGLSFEEDLRGKVVLLDFFTYCCINCMHILPGLHKLEEKFPHSSGLIVIGVHSAKFDNEKDSGNILNAILRYDITHPVVNDPEMTLWQALMVQCWPTLVLVGPQGQILLSLVGEGHMDLLDSLLPLVLEHYKNTRALTSHNIKLDLEKEKLPDSPLLYPGKVAVDTAGKRLAVADTAHHRILVLDSSGHVQLWAGNKQAGHRDGSVTEAQFNSPQGVAWKDNSLYVADTENHCIRLVDLEHGAVSTVAGTGLQGHDKEGGRPGLEQPISSPWDLALHRSTEGGEEDILLIAMAGTHQIWALFLQDVTWMKGKHYTRGTCVRIAGSGNEEIRNNSYPHNASFAQPSGLAIGRKDPEKPDLYLYIADSESSSVRYLSLVDGAVKGLVGGSPDPTNLFAYGDVDGKGFSAKLQHPLAVAYSTTDGVLYVADSYNHKIKQVNPMTGECQTLYKGDGTTKLNEPGGLSVHGQWLYIADANNHTVKLLNLSTLHMSQLVVTFPTLSTPDGVIEADSSARVKRRLPPKSATVLCQSSLQVPPSVCVKLSLSLDDGLHLTEDTDSKWLIYSQSGLDLSPYFSNSTLEGTLNIHSQPQWTLVAPPGCNNSVEITIECVVYFCGSDGTCRMKTVVFLLPLEVNSSGQPIEELRINELCYKISV